MRGSQARESQGRDSKARDSQARDSQVRDFQTRDLKAYISRCEILTDIIPGSKGFEIFHDHDIVS